MPKNSQIINEVSSAKSRSVEHFLFIRQKDQTNHLFLHDSNNIICRVPNSGHFQVPFCLSTLTTEVLFAALMRRGKHLLTTNYTVKDLREFLFGYRGEKRTHAAKLNNQKQINLMRHSNMSKLMCDKNIIKHWVILVCALPVCVTVYNSVALANPYWETWPWFTKFVQNSIPHPWICLRSYFPIQSSWITCGVESSRGLMSFKL